MTIPLRCDNVTHSVLFQVAALPSPVTTKSAVCFTFNTDWLSVFSFVACATAYAGQIINKEHIILKNLFIFKYDPDGNFVHRDIVA
jgi:hypothetical protein